MERTVSERRRYRRCLAGVSLLCLSVGVFASRPRVHGITVDGQGNIYVTASAHSSDFSPARYRWGSR
jgi:beta-propeller repeat-containing protein